ncbi:GNAT family N-acetyltransferase [Salarchaeum japonicum]|uniref:GNAT family N-acetyltransferase n=1 Tax=Salarchaeum japonicum TaxID=555573 RepID=UPI003C7711D3
MSEYVLREELPTPERFCELREAAGMAPRTVADAREGLPNSRYGVTAVHEPTGETVGMARVVGDGATVFHVCDMAVHPDHQQRGLGTRLMDAVVEYIDENASETAYVNLLADVDGFYEQWGFERTAPETKGMSR